MCLCYYKVAGVLVGSKTMPKRRNLSVEQRAAMVTLNKEHYCGRAIAKKLNNRAAVQCKIYSRK